MLRVPLLLEPVLEEEAQEQDGGVHGDDVLEVEAQEPDGVHGGDVLVLEQVPVCDIPLQLVWLLELVYGLVP